MNDIERAIETLKQVSDLDTKLHLNISNYDLLTAIEALQEKAERENPQPLTIWQIRKLDKKPVLIKSDGKTECGLVSLSGNSYTKQEVITVSDGDFYLLCELEFYKVYPFYDHEPKEVETK